MSACGNGFSNPSFSAHDRVRILKGRLEAGRLVVHALLGVYGLVLAYILLGLIFDFPVSGDVFFGLSFALLFFALGQSVYELGAKNAIVFLVISSAVGFLAEALGTNTGIPFGKYHYTNFLGQVALGAVHSMVVSVVLQNLPSRPRAPVPLRALASAAGIKCTTHTGTTPWPQGPRLLRRSAKLPG